MKLEHLKKFFRPSRDRVQLPPEIVGRIFELVAEDTTPLSGKEAKVAAAHGRARARVHALDRRTKAIADAYDANFIARGYVRAMGGKYAPFTARDRSAPPGSWGEPTETPDDRALEALARADALELEQNVEMEMFTTTWFNQVLGRMPGLRSIDLVGFRFCDEEPVGLDLSVLPRLESLTIRHRRSALTSHLDDGPWPPTIERSRLRNAEFLRLERVPSLRSLTLVNLGWKSESVVPFTSLGLRSLTLSFQIPSGGSLPLDDADFRSVAFAGSLRSLTLRQTGLRRPENATLPDGLEHLHLSGRELESMAGLRLPDSLTSLDLGLSPRLDLASVRLPRRLRRLAIADDDASPASGLDALLARAPATLRRVDLNVRDGGPFEKLAAYRQRYPRLEFHVVVEWQRFEPRRARWWLAPR